MPEQPDNSVLLERINYLSEKVAELSGKMSLVDENSRKADVERAREDTRTSMNIDIVEEKVKAIEVDVNLLKGLLPDIQTTMRVMKWAAGIITAVITMLAVAMLTGHAYLVFTP